LKDGILAKFEQFLSVGSDLIGNYETVEEYAKDYILINILKLYEIEEVEFYEKLDKTLVEQSSNSNSNAIEFRFLNDKERFNEGYELNKNLGINKSKRLLLEFNLNKRLNSGLLISPKVKIKFI
jgi:nitrogenase subunit NifH